MSTNTPHAQTIARYILHASPDERRQAYRVILTFIRLRSAVDFGSVHEFLTSESDDALGDEQRTKILAEVCQAIRDGDLMALGAE